jgi:hypothetical protein
VTVHRLAHYRQDDPYTRVPNVTVNDGRLDLKSRGLLLYMLSKPDGWHFRERVLAEHVGVSRAQIRTALQTLIDTGYVRRVRFTSDGAPRVETQVFDVAQPVGTDTEPPLVRVPDGPETVPLSNTEVAVRISNTPAASERRQTDRLFDAMCAACGHDPKRLTSAERGRINKALKDLRTVGATAEEITAAASQWVRIYPNATLTPTAMAAHWTKLTARRSTTSAATDDPDLEQVRAQTRRHW